MATAKRHPRLPGKLWIGTYEFYLKRVHRGDPRLEADAEGMSFWEDSNRGILILDTLDTRHELEVIWHEVTHCVNWVGDIDEDEKPIEGEDIAEKQGVLFTQFFLDNPRFEAWLSFTLKRIRQERAKSDDSADKPAEAA